MRSTPHGMVSPLSLSSGGLTPEGGSRARIGFLVSVCESEDAILGKILIERIANKRNAFFFIVLLTFGVLKICARCCKRKKNLFLSSVSFISVVG